jgi:REP element-mobilizing transposase RayT
MVRPSQSIQSDPIAYFLTWTTYGTWLPGDMRGWSHEQTGHQLRDRQIRRDAMSRMQETPNELNPIERRIVEETVRAHCQIRTWTLFAVNCRSNHVHAVVHASVHPDIAMSQFKSWCTRRLREAQAANSDEQTSRVRWWSEGGSTRYLNDDDAVSSAVRYVLEAQ